MLLNVFYACIASLYLFYAKIVNEVLITNDNKQFSLGFYKYILTKMNHCFRRQISCDTIVLKRSHDVSVK